MSRFFQYISYPFVWLFSKLFSPVEVRGRADFAEYATGPLVIIANHISSYDSFLFRFVTGWKTMPIRFMGVTRFRHLHLRILKWLGIIHATYFLFGVFKIVPGLGAEKNLVTAKKIIRAGGTVMIYPEGSINPSGPLLHFHRGAGLLALETGAPVLPISFAVVGEGLDERTIISVGKPIRLKQGMPVETATAVFYATLETMILETKNAAMEIKTMAPTSAPVAESVRA